MASSSDLNKIIQATLAESKANAVAALSESVEEVETDVDTEVDLSASSDSDVEDLSDDQNVEEEVVEADSEDEEVVEEEVEELDELSKKTLTSYAKKAQKKADSEYKKGEKAEDDAMATDGRKEPGKSKQAALNAKAGQHFSKNIKRQGGVDLALGKLGPKASKKVPDSEVWGGQTPRKDVKVMAKEENEMTDEVNIEEGTAAADSLKPGSNNIDLPRTKLEAITSVLGAMHGMKKTDLLKWYNDTMSQFGPGKTYGVGDNSAKNSSTIDMKGSAASISTGPKTKDGMPKLNVKEDIDALFEGQDLSEEFKDNMGTLFEAAVSAAIIAETARLEEAFEVAFTEALDEQVAEIEEMVSSKLDAYLDVVVEDWMVENEVAIESTLRNELMDEFMEGLKNLFAEHYINVPQTKVDVLEALAEKVSVLEQKLDESITENAELKGYVNEAKMTEVFEELASDLALTQQEKFAALVEGIEFDGNLELYAKKLKVVKEGFFKTEVTASANLEEETFEGDLTESTVYVDPAVSRYVKAISRNVKN